MFYIIFEKAEWFILNLKEILNNQYYNKSTNLIECNKLGKFIRK
jgi:hypothetical protein